MALEQLFNIPHCPRFPLGQQNAIILVNKITFMLDSPDVLFLKKKWAMLLFLVVPFVKDRIEDSASYVPSLLLWFCCLAVQQGPRASLSLMLVF